MTTFARPALALIFLAAFSACTAAHQQDDLKSLAANEGAHNIAILGSGAGPGVPSSDAFQIDIQRMGDVLKGQPFNFDVRAMGDAQPEQLLDAIAKAAGELGPDGTLLFFFSGHGGGGSIYKGDNGMSAQDLNAAAAHGNYARFTAIIEACESGSFAHGAGALQLKSNYKSMLVMTAAKASEESADDGTDSFFPHYMEQNLTALAKDPNAKMRDLADKVFQAAAAANPGQTGDMSAQPESLLDEPVHNPNAGQPSQGGGAGIFVALATNDVAAGDHRVYVTVPSGSTYVALCAGNAVSCASLAANDQKLAPLDALGQIADRSLLQTHALLALDAQNVQTVLVFDSAQATKSRASQTVQFAAK